MSPEILKLVSILALVPSAQIQWVLSVCIIFVEVEFMTELLYCSKLDFTGKPNKVTTECKH